MDNAHVRSCHHCGSKKQTLPCGGCNSVYYCSKEHQKKDWKSHRGSCRYYKVIQEPTKPSCVVATRKIPKGTTVLKSKPIVTGPGPVEPVCIGCMRPMVYDVMSNLCEGCGLPIDVQCQKSPMHQLECRALQEAGFQLDEKELWEDWRLQKFPYYSSAIVAARILLSNQAAKLLKLYREEDHKNFNNLKLLESTSSYIRNKFKLKFDHDTICTAIKVISTASLHLNVWADHFNILELRYGIGVYDCDLVYMKHSCIPNIDAVDTYADPTTTYFIANVDIQPGEKLTINRFLPDLIIPTYERQFFMAACYQYVCTCLRCLDLTELGLHSGSLTCKKCSGMFTYAPFTNFSWVCNKCQFSIKLDEIVKIMEKCQKSLHAASKQPNDLVKFIDGHIGPKGPLHPGHFFIYSAKKEYCTMIHTNSFNKGAAYKIGSEDRDRFHNYTKDLIAHRAKLNQNGYDEHYRCVQVNSRYILHQWFVGNISKEKAQVYIEEVLNDVMRKKLPGNICNWATERLHLNTVSELDQHLIRLARADSGKEQD